MATTAEKRIAEAADALAAESRLAYPKPKSRLILVVDYDDTPDRDAIDRVLDTAREHGGVETAVWYHLAPTREDVR